MRAIKRIALVSLSIYLAGLVAALLYTQLSAPVQAAPSAAPAIHRERLTLNVPGSGDGQSGSVTSGTVIQGRVVRVDIDYGAGVTTTTDLTLADSTALGTANVVSLSNTATDAVVYPTVGLTTNAGVAVTYDGTRPIVDYYPVAGKLTLTLAQTTAATPCATVDIYWEEN